MDGYYVCSTDLWVVGKIKIFVLKEKLDFFVRFVSWSSLIIVLRQRNWQPSRRGSYRRKHESSWIILLWLLRSPSAATEQRPLEVRLSGGCFLRLGVAGRTHSTKCQFSLCTYRYQSYRELLSYRVVCRGINFCLAGGRRWLSRYLLHKFVSCVLLLALSCLLCNCCWLTVCIVVVVLCVLLSYVYLLYCVGIAFFLL